MTAARKRTAKTTKARSPAGVRRAPRIPAALRPLLDIIDDRTVDLATAALKCRADGHPWETDPVSLRQRLALFTRGLSQKLQRCTRCDSLRKEEFYFPSMVKVGGFKYIWSPGYLIAKAFAGSGRLAKEQVRQALEAREVIEALNA